MSNQCGDDEITDYTKIKLTPEELRKYEGYETLSDEEAEIEIQNLAKMAWVLYHHIERKKRTQS